MYFIWTLGMIAAALFGRWLQLNPGKFMVQGTFQSPNSSGAVLARKVIAVQGTFFVVFGIIGVFLSLTFWFNSAALTAIATVIGLTCGAFAAKYVRKEVRAQGDPVPGQFGLWP
jgi:hypothetical protein